MEIYIPVTTAKRQVTRIIREVGFMLKANLSVIEEDRIDLKFILCMTIDSIIGFACI